MTKPKLDVAPKMPRFGRTTSFGENLMRGMSRTVSFETSAKRSTGRASTGQKNATFPQRGVRKTLSLKGDRRRGLDRGSSSNSKSAHKRRVSFGEEQIHTIECVCPSCKDDLWYTRQQLKILQKIELRQNLLCQLKIDADKKSSLEDEECTWRGMEDLEKKKSRQERVINYVNTIVLEHHLNTPSEDIQKLATSMSKVDRDKAHSLGLQDEADARPPSNTGGRKRRSMKWMKRSNSNLSAHNTKGRLASAA